MIKHATRRTAIMLLVCVTGVAVSLLIIRNAPSIDRHYLFRDSVQIGPTDAYERLMNARLLHEPDYDGVVESIVLMTNAGTIDLEMPAYHALHDHVDNGLFSYHFMEPGKAYESVAGRIWIDHLAVARGEFPSERQTEDSIAMSPRYFDPDLREWSEDEKTRRLPGGWTGQLDFRGAYPSIQFFVTSDLEEEAELLGVRVFDARTRHPIAGNLLHQGSIERGLRITGDLRMWHPAPIELVMDVAFGPPEVIELEAEPGSTARYSGGELTLLVKARGMRNLSALTTGTETEVTLIKEPDPDKGSTCLLFTSLPKALAWPLEIECLDVDGRVLPSAGSAAFNIFKRENIIADAEAIHTIRASYFRHRARLVFRFNEIPGLPESNRDIDNLMDVRIPYLKLDREYEFNELIGSLTQMSTPGVGLAGGQFPAPRVYRDVTIAELVEACVRLHGPTYGVVIDQAALSIEFLDMSAQARATRLWNRMRSTFR